MGRIKNSVAYPEYGRIGYIGENFYLENGNSHNFKFKGSYPLGWANAWGALALLAKAGVKLPVDSLPNCDSKLKGGFVIKLDYQSEKLEIKVKIDSIEGFKNGNNNGFYFTGYLLKTYKLTSGMDTDSIPIGGFVFKDHYIAFGNKEEFTPQNYNKLIDPFYKPLSICKAYFGGSFLNNRDVYYGTFCHNNGPQGATIENVFKK